MRDVTAEEEKPPTHPSKNNQLMGAAKKVTWAEQNGTRMNDSAKGVNKTTKRHHGTEQKQWRPKTTTPDIPTATNETQKKQDTGKGWQLGQQK